MARKLKASTNGHEAPKPKKGAKAARAQAPEPQEGAVTEAQKREALDRLYDSDKGRVDAKAKFDRAHSGYRSAFKEACKVTGFSKEAMSWHIKNRAREPHEVDAEMREIARVAQFTNMASGFQAAFDFAGQKPTNAPQDDVKAADAQGYEAGAFGDRPQANPYPEGSPRAESWDGGFKRAQTEIASRMGNGAAAEAHA